MLMLTHILATYVLGRIVGLSAPYEWGLALVFGVAVDLDHLVPPWKLKYFTPEWGFSSKDTPEIVHSPIQEPTAALMIAPLSLLLKTPIPLLFWGLHAILDTLTIFKKRPLWPFSGKIMRYRLFSAGSTAEWILSSAGLAILAIHLLV